MPHGYLIKNFAQVLMTSIEAVGKSLNLFLTQTKQTMSGNSVVSVSSKFDRSSHYPNFYC